MSVRLTVLPRAEYKSSIYIIITCIISLILLVLLASDVGNNMAYPQFIYIIYKYNVTFT